MKEEGRTGRGEMKEGDAGRGEHGVREGVHCRRKGGHGGREMKEGESCRGRAWSEGGS